MASIAGHGGVCCGRRHIYNVNGMTADELASLLRGYRDLNILVEIVIAEENLNYEGLQATVLEAGFKLACSWDNSNSGNTCWMYVWAGQEFTLYGNEQAPVVERIVDRGGVQNPFGAQPPAAPARRELHTYYRNAFADGTRGGWYETLAACTSAAPRCAQYESRLFFSDGQYSTDLHRR